MAVTAVNGNVHLDEIRSPPVFGENVGNVPGSWSLRDAAGEDRIESAGVLEEVDDYYEAPEPVETPLESPRSVYGSPLESRICTPDFMANAIVARGPPKNGVKPPLMRLQTPVSIHQKKFSRLRTFWYRRVATAVPQRACRDHFALERTFLGYVRTSETLSIAAVIISQFFPLQPRETGGLTYAKLAKPCSMVLMSFAMVIVICGFMRFWRQQNAVIHGKIFTASWEPILVGIIMVLVVSMLFAVVMGVENTDAALYQ